MVLENPRGQGVSSRTTTLESTTFVKELVIFHAHPLILTLFTNKQQHKHEM